jgi:GTP cyclohydrolase II
LFDGLRQRRRFTVTVSETTLHCDLAELHRAASAVLLVGRVTAVGTEPDPTMGVDIPTPAGDLRMIPVDTRDGGRTSAVVTLVARPECTSHAPVYLHRGCLLGDALGHLDCPRRRALHDALAQMRRLGRGVVLYHRDDAAPFGCCGGRAGDTWPLPGPVAAGFRGVLDSLQLIAPRVIAFDGDRPAVRQLGLDTAQAPSSKQP